MDSSLLSVIAGMAVGIALVLVFSFMMTEMNNLSSGVSEIFPGHPLSFTCPIIGVRSLVTIEDVSGGFKQYNVSGYTDYFISAGHKGTISYTIHRLGPPAVEVNGTIYRYPDYNYSKVGLDIREIETY